MASVGGEKYRNLYLDGSWDGRWESLEEWKQYCRLTWESMGSGKVLAPPRRAPAAGPNQLTTPKALWMEAGMAGGEASRVDPAVQADLGIYGVGENPSSSSPGPCRGPEANSPLRWPSGWKLGRIS